MPMIYDRFARTFVLTAPSESGYTVRTHHAPPPSELPPPRRERMRQGARELMTVLARSGRRMLLSEIANYLPHVPRETLRVRLSSLSTRGDITKYGDRNNYRYAIPSSSTFMST